DYYCQLWDGGSGVF
nr:immunoglobulin light chain junction region [Macaca mulatta]MOX19570.1 immunoglobulin light chain junction region [Macaca mulatta]MOX20465.1 immunoglobulin light chain junction region [Macaca mulatta]MOX22678.1 immunoglobulin light chain junction region [Macaca mulatta]